MFHSSSLCLRILCIGMSNCVVVVVKCVCGYVWCVIMGRSVVLCDGFLVFVFF